MVGARVAFAWMLVWSACSQPIVPAEGSEASSGTGEAPGSTSLGATGSAMSTTAGDGVDTSTSSASVDSSSGCEDLPLGSPCRGSDPVCECESDQCFAGLFGGLCSECDEDADCERGHVCRPHPSDVRTPARCVVPPPPCRPGDHCPCETANDCPRDEHCPLLIEVRGVVSASFCSECDGDMGCAPDQICVPSYDIAALEGYHYCVAPGSVPDDGGCDIDGDGTECASGQCAPAALQGIPLLGLCSPCNDDVDCGGGMICQLPEITLVDDAVVLAPGMCV